MALCYTQRDAARWAVFSGDHNPIHFDPAEARRLGMDRLCIHGMRALLEVKSGLSQALEKHLFCSDGFLFSSRLRAPVLFDIPYQLSLNETCQGDRLQIGGKLVNSDTQQSSINSKLSVAMPLTLSPVIRASMLPGDRLSAIYNQFLTVENNPVPLWSLLDAILFRQLVNATETLESVRDLIPGHKANCLGDILSLVQVVQTHHQVHFASWLLQPVEKVWSGEPLHYAIQPTLVMGEKAPGLVLVTGIQAWRTDEPLIAVTVTLKTGPLATE
ncbi:MaoC like domain-containing protein [Izhakiella capsodis]|uniref:MaoC like domain-containing protein n=1 Tax=Izhakiella capsodis TaxID=1367852 RepID=A0A1I4XFJ5_9GAMM|nr:MaoC/PaaZ C-terminal domain-containing protein [Izhakiella capsodis]SFN24545.1 MaoC like domain-containing protein [Izhakiella capsodis]